VNTYNNSGLIQYEDIKAEMNTTMINLDPSSPIPFGAYINVEEEESELVPYYNESPVEILGPTPTWVFTSVSKASNAKTISKLPIYYDGVSTSTARIGHNKYQGYIKVMDDSYDIYLFPTDKYEVYEVSTDDTILLFNDINQNFGEFKGIKTVSGKKIISASDYVEATWQMSNYKADKNTYYTILNNAKAKKRKADNLANSIDHLDIIKEDAINNK
jgi:hypothetical protein